MRIHVNSLKIYISIVIKYSVSAMPLCRVNECFFFVYNTFFMNNDHCVYNL